MCSRLERLSRLENWIVQGFIKNGCLCRRSYDTFSNLLHIAGHAQYRYYTDIVRSFKTLWPAYPCPTSRRRGGVITPHRERTNLSTLNFLFAKDCSTMLAHFTSGAEGITSLAADICPKFVHFIFSYVPHETIFRGEITFCSLASLGPLQANR